ncbi:pentatricopeptide repeat-containing protein At1g15510, chloroplastic [Dioscorea cayenensis subsp. rotundata]|uniref:Pentatricopeptide repeat-containing protein At1g15510, chloroplastic n=1 Tax=Dioscorea cayennensis subsp. rotundata TaxID=55577 RepID=A0AB40AR83_DIOCR|nr:pentatricopeptide repeat-containing protein At1g15510, chloroplastic [Dioscorea cayenensis subsp. rotundata]
MCKVQTLPSFLPFQFPTMAAASDPFFLLSNHYSFISSSLSKHPFKPATSLPFFSDSKTTQLISFSSLHPHSPTTHSSSNPIPAIRRLCLDGDLDQALRLLPSSEQFPLDEDTYISLLRLCEWKRALPQGSRLYSHISSSDILLSVALGNALLSMFVRFGNLLEAWSVFGKMIERDVFSWNVMVGGHAKSGFFDEALDLYQRMIWSGMWPDVYTFPCVLRTCGGVPDLVRGREVHAHVFRFGSASEVDVLNALITMYAKCGQLVDARKVFDTMPRRDCISWNAMIAGFFENEKFYDGLELFLMMRNHSVEPDLMTVTSVISASGWLCDVSLGKEIHGYAVKGGFSVDVSVQNSLIQMYASFGNLHQAQKIFLRMESKDVVSWTAMISGHEKNGLPEKSLEIFDQMKRADVSPDEVTLASVLSACATLGRVDVGVEVHELAKKKRLMPYTVIGNSLLDMYSKAKCVDKAMEVFRGMREKNVISWSSIISGFRINRRSFEALNYFRHMQAFVEPNSVTLISTLSACAAVGALVWGKEIHAQALRRAMGTEGFVPNAILDLYVKCGRMDYAWMQFNSLEEKDVVSWNIMMTGYAVRGHGDLAVDLFKRMEEKGVLPDEVTFIALLCACSRSGMVNQGWEYFDNMHKKYSITPSLRHYACMVDLLGRAGWLEEAQQFIKEMPIEPDAAIWGALLNGCRIHRQVDLGELAANYLFELDAQSVGYYVLLCNLYADSDRWDQVARVRKEMRERGLTIDPGCSWVEVKGMVHAFLSGDESHPQSKEINGALNGLYERIKSAGFDLPENDIVDEAEASKAEIFCGHSERLAIAFGLISTAPGTAIWVTKNLYMCQGCHALVKSISKIVRREITVRDTEQFHHFKDGKCSCGDEGYWKRCVGLKQEHGV